MSIKKLFLVQETANYTTRLSRSCYRASSYYSTVTPKTLSILTPNAVWEVHCLTAWEFRSALVELYIVNTLGYRIAPWVMWFGSQGVEIWSIQNSNTMERFFHFWNEKGICILSVLGITTFCFKHCLNPSRHAFNYFLTFLNWYSLPLHFNPFPQFMDSIGGVFMLCKLSLETTPEIFNGIQVWRLRRPNYCPEFLLL